ncbi:MAG: UvrD-helicase domain-containing protein [Planctomycetes bacterium]|nr:UvrD-helicase domain-containing protein [Planctomycetota bacterium]
MSDIQWTEAQRAAIATIDRSVLVSAGAGSGKTAVLAERCAHLVLDADPPCDIDELLVVTFTEAAAGEMRERIGRSLRRRMIDRPNDARLRRQLVFLDTARYRRYTPSAAAFSIDTLRRPTSIPRRRFSIRTKPAS